MNKSLINQLSPSDVSVLTFKKKTYLVLTYLMIAALVALTLATRLMLRDQPVDSMVMWFLYIEFPVFLAILLNVHLNYRRVKRDLSQNQKELLEAKLKEKYQRRGRCYFVLGRRSYLLTSNDFFETYHVGDLVKIWVAPNCKLLLQTLEHQS